MPKSNVYDFLARGTTNPTLGIYDNRSEEFLGCDLEFELEEKPECEIPLFKDLRAFRRCVYRGGDAQEC